MSKSFNEKLASLLQKDIRFTDENGKLIRTEIVNAAFKIDKKLIEMRSAISERYRTHPNQCMRSIPIVSKVDCWGPLRPRYLKNSHRSKKTNLLNVCNCLYESIKAKNQEW